MIRAALTVVLGLGVVALVACSGAQSRAEAQLAAINAGCEVGLSIERDAGAAGAADETARGCAAELRTWEHAR